MIRATPFRQSLEILNEFGETISADLRYLPSAPLQALIVVVHSFMAFKDWGFFPRVSEEFARRGYGTLSFNFSRNGVTGSNDRITDFVKFSENTFTHELTDLQTIIDRIGDGSILPPGSHPPKIILLGHSRGGGISIVTAARDPRVNALVTWSSIATFDRWTEHQKLIWRRDGYLRLSRGGDPSPLKLGIRLLEDYEEHSESLNILNAAGRITIPWLIIHGKTDLTVPVSEGESLFNASNSLMKEFVPLDAVGHLYNAARKTDDDYSTLESVIKITHTWLKKSIS